ncbi:phospholipid-binding protein [Leptolyngbya sp. FACHB-36]|uniref:phospholipid-binding protein n=1 Tax=Leptolyngbya sp. FACHB-36 TaxID=2692808 RepID=UPI00168160A3|nr:phospholipid-binding protein [Leptolyngbya sp. FACHB-36]MBD2019608.1 phospholipid-binding protein [Leptolyngbya sp. FACHB-36]
MGFLVHCQSLEKDRNAQSQAGMPKQVENLTENSVPCFFTTIPPERVGLNGEYDHNGLAKRVERTFRQRFPGAYLDQLRINQRGRVVILIGKVLNHEVLCQLASTALEVAGASSVETHAVALLDRSHSDVA